MEKFGIFELLDALAAITQMQDPPAGVAAKNAAEKERERKLPDASFSPPTYGAPLTQPNPSSTAYGAFMERHERAKGKVKK
ncbi:MAG: hypothetical protein IKD43_03695 [Clostridia bacterium]|nr:hypothetical protein [Clostridia bacterium]